MLGELLQGRRKRRVRKPTFGNVYVYPVQLLIMKKISRQSTTNKQDMPLVLRDGFWCIQFLPRCSYPRRRPVWGCVSDNQDQDCRGGARMRLEYISTVTSTFATVRLAHDHDGISRIPYRPPYGDGKVHRTNPDYMGFSVGWGPNCGAFCSAAGTGCHICGK